MGNEKMEDKEPADRRPRRQPLPVRRVTRHAFAVGEVVKVLPNAMERKPKDIAKSLYAYDFTITRLLPEETSALQYRIKNVATGQERVAHESELYSAAAGDETSAT